MLCFCLYIKNYKGETEDIRVDVSKDGAID